MEFSNKISGFQSMRKLQQPFKGVCDVNSFSINFDLKISMTEFK